jgi:hypothetical protein
MARPQIGYRNAAGETIPGTTTIIGRFKDSGALLHWAFGQGKAAERGEIRSLYDKRDEAASIGTLVHEMVEAHIGKVDFDESKLVGLSEENRERVNSGYRAYRSWESMTRLEIVEQEMALVSELHQFGGTPDAIGRFNNELCLLDWKSSNGVYQDYLIQLAAYALLWEENRPDEHLVGGFHLCRFAKEHGDFSHHYWQNLDEAKEQFILFRRAYDLDKQLKKRAA